MEQESPRVCERALSRLADDAMLFEGSATLRECLSMVTEKVLKKILDSL